MKGTTFTEGMCDRIREPGPILQMHRREGAEEVSLDHIGRTLHSDAKKLAFGSQALGMS